MNIAITRARKLIYSKAGYELKDDKLVQDIIDYSGLWQESEGRRLALLGDMVLRQAVLLNWYPTGRSPGTFDRRHIVTLPLWDENMLTRRALPGAASNLLENMTSNRTLASRGRILGIDKLIVHPPFLLGSSLAKTNNSDIRIATAVEAAIGAIWLQSEQDIHTINAALKKMNFHRPLLP